MPINDFLQRLRSLQKARHWGAILILSVLLYGLLIFWAESRDVLESFRRVSTSRIVLVLIIVVVGFALRWSRWRIFCRRVGLLLPWKEDLTVFMAGLSMAISPAKLGEVVKPILIRRHYGHPKRITLGLVMAERLLDVLGVLVLCVVGLLSTAVQLPVALLVMTAILLLVLLLLVAKFDSLFGWVAHFLPSRWEGRFQSLSETFQSCSSLFQPAHLLAPLILTFLAWGLEGFGLLILTRELYPAIESGPVIATYAAATLIGGFVFLPGGLGVTDGTIAGLLLRLQVSRADAVALTFLIRLCTLWFAVFLGALIYLIGRRYLATVEKTR